MKSSYFNLLFPVLCVNLITRVSILQTSPTAQLIGKAFTNLATNYSELFKANLLQVNEADRIHLQTVMRFIIQQQQQQQQQGGSQNQFMSGQQTVATSAGVGGKSLNIDMNKYKVQK
jgi:hypothetical protein